MRVLLVGLVLSLAACGSSPDNGITNPPPVPKKPDPYVTVRVRDLMDTTTAPGRAHWHIFSMLTGPYDRLNGIGLAGTIGLDDVRLHHNIICASVSADSVGQRLLTIVAFADTTTDQPTADLQFSTFSKQWYDGTRILPNGWMVLTFPAADAWQSQQYLAGHGLVAADPIKWNFDWTANGTANFAERTDSDTECNHA